MAQHTNGFPKKEHLKSKSIIDTLYASGTSATVFPLRAVFMLLPAREDAPTATILISVAKRRFHHAVDRNLVKRRIREAYRLNKQPFIAELRKSEKQIAVAIQYIDTKHNSTQFLKQKMSKLLGKILEKQNTNA